MNLESVTSLALLVAGLRTVLDRQLEIQGQMQEKEKRGKSRGASILPAIH
jgi:hypothetical protein